MSDESNIIEIEPQQAMQVFTAENGLKPYLDKVWTVVEAFLATKPDVTTKQGMADIRSMAVRVGKMKSHIEREGKKVADEVKAIPKKVDAARRIANDTLQAWQDEVRAPLTKWEAAEEARKGRHIAALDRITALRDNLAGLDLLTLQKRLEEALAPVPSNADEFEEQYTQTREWSLKDLNAAVTARLQHDKDQAELARLRAAQAEQERKDREDRIAAEAAAGARVAAENAAREAHEAAERRTREAEERAARAEREAQEAVAAEQKRVAQAAADEKAANERRERNARHRAKVEREAAAAFVAGGMSEVPAELAVALIVAGKVPGVTISY